MAVPLDEVVGAAFSSADPAEACRSTLDALRSALGAEEAVFARGDAGGGSATVVHRSPGATEEPAGSILVPALDVDEPLVLDGAGGADVLAIGLRLREAPPWCVALLRPHAKPWTAHDREALARARPYVALVLDHAVARQRLADQQAILSASRGRLIGVLAHELRNPLAPILMWTSTLKRLRKEDAEVLRAAQAIEHAVSLERRLIEDMIDVSRLERGMITLQREPMDLRDEVRRLVDEHRTQATEAQVTVVADLPGGPVLVDGDPARLGQAIGNLLGNAIKFTPVGGLVAVSLHCRGDRAQLSISDTGPGLPAEVQPALFSPFIQGPNARGGLGVGLAVARWLVDLHGGVIEALPGGENGGATFHVALPLRTAHGRAAP